MNRNLLKAEMIKHGYNGQTLSEEIGISESAFYRKMNGASEFTQGEIMAIKKILEMDHDTVFAVFLNDEVS